MSTGRFECWVAVGVLMAAWEMTVELCSEGYVAFLCASVVWNDEAWVWCSWGQQLYLKGSCIDCFWTWWIGLLVLRALPWCILNSVWVHRWRLCWCHRGLIDMQGQVEWICQGLVQQHRFQFRWSVIFPHWLMNMIWICDIKLWNIQDVSRYDSWRLRPPEMKLLIQDVGGGGGGLEV